MPTQRDPDQLLALALAAVEAKRPRFERRSGNERRTGIERRAAVNPCFRGKERRTQERRSGVDQRLVSTILAPPAADPF